MISLQVSPGEFFDKLSILQLKWQRVVDAKKRHQIAAELEIFDCLRKEAIPYLASLEQLIAELSTVNARLWDIENDLRRCERQAVFGQRFVELARAVYHENDRRAALKLQINELLESPLVEVKEYSS